MTDALNEEFEISLNPALFVQAIISFPCFKEAKPDTPADELFEVILEAYKGDNLTEEQDLVVELLLHLQEDTSPFNLKRAKEIWSNEDLKAMHQLLLNKSP